jgi:hypothetical protein
LDSIRGGIDELGVARVVVVWPDADEMRRAHPDDAQLHGANATTTTPAAYERIAAGAS